jgi:hypothetical protein
MHALIIALCLAAGGADTGDGYLLQSPGKNSPADIDAWRKGEQRGGLKPYPNAVPPGTPNPPEPLWEYGGSCSTSWALPDLPVPTFSQWLKEQAAQRPSVDRRAHEILAKRYTLDCRTE